MPEQFLSLAAAIILATLLSYTEASMFDSHPKFILKAENNRAFDSSSLVKTFIMKSGNVAECLEHCLQDCRCQSFQICQNTRCQLCSSHKKENSSLLHDKDGCVYATYDIQQPSQIFQKLNKQCSHMSCSMKYNCCQQPDLCPMNKVCKPFNSSTEPWKRFTCECRDGYYGKNCDQPIRSCAGYFNVRQKSGEYIVVDSQNSEYEVYCHFDSEAAWTLVQSYNYENVKHNGNHDFPNLKKPLWEDKPVSENSVAWNAYRLSYSKMKSIKDNSTFLQFTCNYKKHRNITNFDYVQIFLKNVTNSSGQRNVDVIQLDAGHTYTEQSRATVGNVRGKIGDCDLSCCQIQLAQSKERSLHVHFSDSNSPPCEFITGSNELRHCAFFGSYHHHTAEGHSCIEYQHSTTQLWFGARNP